MFLVLMPSALQVGYRVLRPEYNIRTKRMEMRASMQWQPTNRHKMYVQQL